LMKYLILSIFFLPLQSLFLIFFLPSIRKWGILQIKVTKDKTVTLFKQWQWITNDRNNNHPRWWRRRKLSLCA
jgi:hypothetical protein